MTSNKVQILLDSQISDENAIEVFDRLFSKKVRSKHPKIYCSWCLEPIPYSSKVPEEKRTYYSSFLRFAHDTPWYQTSYLKLCSECFHTLQSFSEMKKINAIIP
ncbi:MAG: hypothetical protein ACTSP4_00055 [Candidatus Hodarchaeales archaeon]